MHENSGGAASATAALGDPPVAEQSRWNAASGCKVKGLACRGTILRGPHSKDYSILVVLLFRGNYHEGLRIQGIVQDVGYRVRGLGFRV